VIRWALLLLPAIAGAATPVTAVAYSPDGALLVASDGVWDAKTNQLLRRVPALEGAVRAIAFRGQSHTAAVATGVPGRSGAVSLVDLDTGAATPIAKSKDEMLAVAFSPDARLLAFGGTDATVHVWDFEAKKEVATMPHAGWVTGLSFFPDGKALASGSADKTVGIWDTKDWKNLYQLPLTPADGVNAVAVAPEGDIVAWASEEHAVRIWRTQNVFNETELARPGRRQALMYTRPLDTGSCVPLALAWMKAPQHSRLVAACDDKTVRVLGPTGNTFFTLQGHTDWVYAAAASPDGAKIATGSGDGTVKIWSSAGRLLTTLGEEKTK
jgi:WD40 repeat protein